MLAKRIIPCLDVTAGRVVKGVNFVNLRDAGDPVELADLFTRGGGDDEGIDVIEWACRGEAFGAGEILLTSMDTDGVQTGFDCELTRAVSRATHIPVIASGGAGKPDDFSRVLTDGEADAAL